MESIADAWKFIIAVGAGTGLVYILRWFWWRINAWSEVSAMIAAFLTSISVRYGFHLRESDPAEFAKIVLITVAVTTTVWLAVTFLTKPEPKDVLLAFYRRVRPNAALWGSIAREASDIIPRKDGLFNLMDWLSGVAMIYAFLFGAGKIIFGETLLGIVFLLAGFLFARVIYADLSGRGWETIGR
jgi:hypothetical protein